MDPDPIPTYRDLLKRRPDAGDPHEAAVVSIEAARVRRELADLPEPERSVLRLRYGIAGRSLNARRHRAPGEAA